MPIGNFKWLQQISICVCPALPAQSVTPLESPVISFSPSVLSNLNRDRRLKSDVRA